MLNLFAAPLLALCAWLPLAAAAEPASPAKPTGELGQFLGAKDTPHPDWFRESFLDFQEDVNQAAADGKRVMLYVYQAGCPYCNRLVEHNFTQKDIHDQVRKNFDVIALNMWGDREVTIVDGKSMTEKQFARAIGAQFTPTLLFFDEQANIVLRINGYYPPQNFRVALDFVAGHQETKTNYKEYFRQRNPAPGPGKLRDEDFFRKPPFDLTVKARGERPLAVVFEQANCKDCTQLHDKVFANPATREIIGRYDMVQLDMWSDTPVTTPDGQQTTARQWALDADVNFAPSILFFDTAGKNIIRADGMFKNFHLQSMFDYVLSGGYRTEPQFQRYIAARAEHLREQGIDVDIWE